MARGDASSRPFSWVGLGSARCPALGQWRFQHAGPLTKCPNSFQARLEVIRFGQTRTQFAGSSLAPTGFAKLGLTLIRDRAWPNISQPYLPERGPTIRFVDHGVAPVAAVEATDLVLPHRQPAASVHLTRRDAHNVLHPPSIAVTGRRVHARSRCVRPGALVVPGRSRVPGTGHRVVGRATFRAAAANSSPALAALA